MIFHLFGYPNLHPHQQCTKVSLFSTSFITFVLCGLFDDSYSDRCKVISHCFFFIVVLSLFSDGMILYIENPINK